MINISVIMTDTFLMFIKQYFKDMFSKFLSKLSLKFSNLISKVLFVACIKLFEFYSLIRSSIEILAFKFLLSFRITSKTAIPFFITLENLSLLASC